MNLAIRGIEADLGPRWGDSFHEDLHPDLKADFILANPPFNVSDWGGDRLRDDPRWRYGTPPAGNANFAWLQHMASHLSPKGVAGVVLANGSLSSQQSGEGDIRRKMVEDDLHRRAPGPALLHDPDPRLPVVPEPQQAQRLRSGQLARPPR
jgi:type I restriction enzyme M protein